MPVASRSNQGLANQLGQLGGLASLAGINLGGSNSNTAEPLAVLRSREFAREFIEHENLMPLLFKEKWVPLAEGAPSAYRQKDIDIRDGVRFFDRRIRDVQEDKKTGLVTLTIAWTDPKIAADWANLLVERVNEKMRARALDEAEANLSYLRAELAAANVVALQQSIGRLLENELQKVMLAKGNQEFSYRFVDRAVTPKWRSSPKRLQLLVLGGLAGVIVALALVFVRDSVRRYRMTKSMPQVAAP
jgi:LPS O-antigen subunit length determinant protein (WzzB/FepE family)